MDDKIYKIKLDLLYYGVKLSDACYDSLKKGIDGNVNHNDYITTKGLFLVVDNNIYVNANLNDLSVYVIDFIDGMYYLTKDNKKFHKVNIIQPPLFALNKIELEPNILITDLVNLHGDRLRISPIDGCAYSCLFCGLYKNKYKENPINMLDSAVEYVIRECKFNHILISGGTPLESENSYKYLDEVYEYFGKKYGSIYPIDVMLVPRGIHPHDRSDDSYQEFLLKLKSFNISGIYINLELYNDHTSKLLMPKKNLIGKSEYIKFIKMAVEIFGVGNVKSCIIVGLESKEDTLKAVELLSQIGCIPVLSPYVPISKKIDVPTPEFMESILLASQEIVSKYNLELGPKCDYCKHNTIHFR